MTINRRCFILKKFKNQRIVKRKAAKELAKKDEVNKYINDEEASEFLKLMKYSDYSIVDQLKKTPT